MGQLGLMSAGNRDPPKFIPALFHRQSKYSSGGPHGYRDAHYPLVLPFPSADPLTKDRF